MGPATSSKGHFETLQSYYASLESRIGYHVLLGGTKHFAYYEDENAWPWPISKALRAMEDLLFDNLDLPAGSLVLDAGCGYGHVACRGAERGLRIECIDIVSRHVRRAQQAIRSRGLSDRVKARVGDYHDLSAFNASTFDGLYTMETFVHANDPERAMSEFFRVLQPGGHLVMNEYEHVLRDKVSEQERKAMDIIDKHSAMPAHSRFTVGTLKKMADAAGFVVVSVEDISFHTQPLVWLFYIIAFLPYLLLSALGLQHHFVNTVAAVESYRLGRKGILQYVVLKAQKPGTLQAAETHAMSGAERTEARKRL